MSRIEIAVLAIAATLVLLCTGVACYQIGAADARTAMARSQVPQGFQKVWTGRVKCSDGRMKSGEVYEGLENGRLVRVIVKTGNAQLEITRF